MGIDKPHGHVDGYFPIIAHRWFSSLKLEKAGKRGVGGLEMVSIRK